MNGRIRKAGGILLMLLCMGVSSGCASSQKVTQDPLAEETLDTDKPEQEAEFSPEMQFLVEAAHQGISPQEAKTYLQVLTEDNIFQDGAMALTGLLIDDIDGNGQKDLLVMVLDAEEKPFYGSGGLWFYMNEDEPYCFAEEECSFYGWFDAFWADIDNDENVEIVFSAQGTGCGAVGDSYKAVFKYKDHAIEQMKLPSDFEEDDDCGLDVGVFQEPEADSYSAYCPYFDEWISFHAENIDIEGWGIPSTVQAVGGNARGFYNLRVAEYEGKKVLQASEYLFGEGGIVHNVATAQFLITWKPDGTPQVLKWWIEVHENAYANSHESRIDFADDSYYYASQLDYQLYRTQKDGNGTLLLANIHSGNICVQDDAIYFLNLSDGQGIYRMQTDGSGMEKLCGRGQQMQVSAEYVYFCSTYEAEYDKSGLVTGKPSEFDHEFLYRMKKDGSERELIATDVRQYVLSDGYASKVQYAGSIYCSKWEEKGVTIYRMDLDGQKEEELFHFYFGKMGDMMVYEGSLYYEGDCFGNREKISRFCLRNGELSSFAVPEYTDCCIYKGYLYALNEQEEDDYHYKVSIYRMNLDGENCETLYEYSFDCKYRDGYLSDLYATGEGVFFRRFVSEQEGCQWFRLTEDGKAAEWEDKEKIPGVPLAQYIEYGGLSSVMSVLESTEGYEAYLADDLEYEEYYSVGEDGESYNPYNIRLPQFNSRIAGYQQINRYFQEALKEKEEFFKMLEEDPQAPTYLYQLITDYNYIYIDENYITVAQYEGGYWGGIRSWITPYPVTFDRQSGEVVSMEQLLGMPVQEAVTELTSSVYKYMEGIGRGRFLLKEEDLLIENYNPEQFFLFPHGIGIYYERYAIDCETAGDFLFVIPWEIKNL